MSDTPSHEVDTLIQHTQKANCAINKTWFEGQVGSDPKYMGGNQAEHKTSFAAFSIAINETYKKEDTIKSKTTWVPVVCYGSLADTAALYIKKGKRLMIDGKLAASTWTDKEGNSRTTLQVVAHAFRFLDPKPQAHKPDECSDESDTSAA